jgi:hypothetical protein
MKFIVDRQTWYRGKGPYTSYLLKRDGSRCCIGFVGQQCQIPDQELMNVPSISGLANGCGGLFPQWMLQSQINKAYTTNDDPTLTDFEREIQLQVLFAEHGDEIVFEN